MNVVENNITSASLKPCTLTAAPPQDAVFDQLFVGRSASFLVSCPEMVQGRLVAEDIVVETPML